MRHYPLRKAPKSKSVPHTTWHDCQPTREESKPAQHKKHKRFNPKYDGPKRKKA